MKKDYILSSGIPLCNIQGYMQPNKISCGCIGSKSLRAMLKKKKKKVLKKEGRRSLKNKVLISWLATHTTKQNFKLRMIGGIVEQLADCILRTTDISPHPHPQGFVLSSSRSSRRSQPRYYIAYGAILLDKPRRLERERATREE